MSILIDRETSVLVQGITGRDGSFHTARMLEYGTRVTAGVTPGKGGGAVHGVPVYNSVEEARGAHPVTCSVIFVPALFATSAIREAADAGIPLIVCITEGIPVMEMLGNYHYVRERGLRLIGPNCPGVITPDACKAGIMPGRIHRRGNVGVISRSGTLTYEIVYHLTLAGMGQSTCVGVGGDPVIGTGFVELLEMFERDPETGAVVIIGEIGGEDEERAARYIAELMSTPVVAFISGRTAPEGKRMGHAGAIVSGGKGTAQAKIQAMREAGVPVADRPDQVPELVRG
ncbi:MAG: succinate--CoA ligase subunit alpha, partial [Spirochaetota bacterium]